MTRFVGKEIVIDAPRALVWTYLEDPDLLSAWLMHTDYRPELGREFRFFSAPRRGWDGVVHCQLTELEPPERLSFTWNASDLGANTVVTIELLEEDGRTRLRLFHTNFDAVRDPDAAVERHAEGWADHLAVLAQQAGEDVADERGAPPIDWTEFRLHVAIAAPPDMVLDRWRTVAGMESFFVEMMRIVAPDGVPRTRDEPAVAGDRYTWRWHSGRRVAGVYLASEPAEVCFGFGESKVSVCASPYRHGSLLVLRQFEIPDTEHARMHIHANCRASWVYFLTLLKTVLEAGVDGRDRTRDTGASFSTYFDPSVLSRPAAG